MLGMRSPVKIMALLILALVAVAVWQVARPSPEQQLRSIGSRPVPSEPGGPLGVSITSEITNVPDILARFSFATYVDRTPVGSVADDSVTFDLRPGQLITIHVDGAELDLPTRRLTAARSVTSAPGMIHFAAYEPSCPAGDSCIESLDVLGVATPDIAPGRYTVKIPVNWSRGDLDPWSGPDEGRGQLALRIEVRAGTFD